MHLKNVSLLSQMPLVERWTPKAPVTEAQALPGAASMIST